MKKKFLLNLLLLSATFNLLSCRDSKPPCDDSESARIHPRAQERSGVQEPSNSFHSQTLSILKRQHLTQEETTLVYNRLDQTTSKTFAEIRQLILDSDLSTYLKYRLLSRSLYGLAQSGAYDEALSYARDETNPSNRSTLLAGVFGGNRGPVDKMLKDFSTLTDLEKEGSSNGIAVSLASRGFLNVDEFTISEDLDKRLKQALASGLESYAASDLSRLPQVKQICETLLTSNVNNNGIYEKALEFLVSQHSELVLQELMELNVNQNPQRESLITALSRRDPEATARTLAKLDDIKGLASSVGGWAKVDLHQAQTWLEQNRSMLSNPAWDASIFSIAKTLASQSSDFTEANKFIENIGDPSVRDAAKNTVRKLEGEAVAKEVAKDPQGTLESITSGASRYDVSWLEVSITKWMQKDSAAAQAWYQKNYSSLPASKAQYIAAAFANMAIDSGNRNIAEEWLDHIEDIQIRERIKTRLSNQ